MSFLLKSEPIDYQLTVHYNNYKNAYLFFTGISRDFILDFNYMSNHMDKESVAKELPAMYNFINTYGKEKIQSWLNTFIVRNVA